MLVLITGGPGTANAWICQAVCRAFVLADTALLDAEKINNFLNENNFLTEHNLAVGETGFSVCECRPQELIIQLSPLIKHSAIGIMATSMHFLPIPIRELGRQADDHNFIVGTHVPMGDFIQSDLFDYIHAVIFTHRNPIDEMASFSRLYGITSDNLNRIDRNEEISEILYDAKTNAKNYLIGQADARYSILWKRHSMHAIRQGYIDFIKAKDGGLNVHDFRFEDVTLTQEKDEIRRLMDILGLQNKGDNVWAYLNKNKKPGQLGFHANKKKFDIGMDYFGPRIYQQLMDFFGDIMVLFNYTSLKDYAPFLKTADKINVITVGEETALISDTKFILNKLCPIIEDKKVTALDLYGISLERQKKYIILPADYRSFWQSREYISSCQPANVIIHPLFLSLHGYRETVFELTTRTNLFIDEIPAQGDNFAIINNAGFPVHQRDYFERLRINLMEQKKSFVSLEFKDQTSHSRIKRCINRHVINNCFFESYDKQQTTVIGDKEGVDLFHGFADRELECTTITSHHYQTWQTQSIPKGDDCFIIYNSENGMNWLWQIVSALLDNAIENFFIVHTHILTHKLTYDHTPDNTGIIDTVIINSNRPAEIYNMARELPATVKIISLLPLYRYQEDTLMARAAMMDSPDVSPLHVERKE